MPRDEETVDRIFAGNLDGLPPLSSKVNFFNFVLSFFPAFHLFQGGAHLHQFHLHWHADGEEHVDGIRLPQDQGVLSWEARTGVPGLDILNSSRSSQIESRNGPSFEKGLISVQVVDMRWGVRDEMTDEHMTTVSTNWIGQNSNHTNWNILWPCSLFEQALCMNELTGCQKYSMGPNFIYFGAQK